MITTKTPSESFEIVKKNLIAMKQQNYKYKYDVWLADEKVEKETIKWCKKNGVKISCRYGIKKYHNETWPRRTKCKEGNLAYFYDKYGYDNYDIVAQFDTDHIPNRSYLKNIIKAFSDEKIGYVAAPNVCDANVKNSWIARGRLYFDASTHGVMQASYNGGFAPMCTGGHYAIRTKALKKSGGLGPELAEDHSTTLILNSNGWDGAYAFDALASGDGPINFADAMTQEFQWSRSILNILFGWTYKYWKTLTLKKKFQFIYLQSWYLMILFTMVLGFILPIIGVITNYPLLNVDYFQFIERYWLCDLILIVITLFIRKNKLLRPVNSPVLSWEAVLYNIVKWPWAFLGLIYSISDSIREKAFAFKITPKGTTVQKSITLGSIAPYLILSGISSIVALIYRYNSNEYVRGYYYMVLANAVMYFVITLVIILKHSHENLRLITINKLQFFTLCLLLGLIFISLK